MLHKSHSASSQKQLFACHFPRARRSWLHPPPISHSNKTRPAPSDKSHRSFPFVFSPARVPLSLVAKAPATCLPNVLHQLMYHCNYVFSIHSCSVDPKPGLIFSILPYMENGPNGLVLLKAHGSLLVGFVPVEDTLQHLVCLCVYSGCQRYGFCSNLFVQMASMY